MQFEVLADRKLSVELQALLLRSFDCGHAIYSQSAFRCAFLSGPLMPFAFDKRYCYSSYIHLCNFIFQSTCCLAIYLLPCDLPAALRSTCCLVFLASLRVSSLCFG
eukprot:m.68238 g.68238  ORF g.68238 m.68238 type:complete len:106 (+) comp13673_c1_seq1:48-365(+)